MLATTAPPRPVDRTARLATTPANDPGPQFEDIADRAGVRFQYDCGANGNLFIADTMGGGVGLIDFDGDGWLDIYFVNGCRIALSIVQSPPRPNRLYRNRGDGTFEDVTERAGVGGRGYGMGCAVGDYDNDGHDDLFVTGLDRTVLYRNRGDGTFEDVTAPRRRRLVALDDGGGVRQTWTATATSTSSSSPTSTPTPRRSADCRDEFGKPIHCPPGTFPAQLDHLFRNNGDGTFTDVSREAGVEVPDGRGLGLAIADLDGDGRLDLFVANDASPNFLFRNLGGLRFEEVGMHGGGRLRRRRARPPPAWASSPTTSTATAGSTCSTPTSSTSRTPCGGTSAAACSPTRRWRRGSPPRADR